MGIFGNSSTFDADVEKATSENNSSEDWSLFLEICDRAAASPAAAREALRAVTRRLAHPDPHVALQAATLLDALVHNSGRALLLEVASRDFELEFRRVLSRAAPPLAAALRASLRRWAEGEFRGDPQLDLLPSLYHKLRQEGHDFDDTGPPAPRPAAAAPAAAAAAEQEQLARAIALSLQEGPAPGPVAVSATVPSAAPLYPSVEARQVRALYDFEAAEDNELTFLAGEIIHVTDAGDPNWWKGYNKRGEGLFPANFVTADLAELTHRDRDDAARKVQFADEETREARDTREVRDAREVRDTREEPRIDEAAMDAALAALHEADPAAGPDSEQAAGRTLERAVYEMGPLIDAALQRADRRHATLTQLSADLVDALNLYHSLMREPLKSMGPPPPPPAQMYGGYFPPGPPGSLGPPGPPGPPAQRPY